MTTVGTRPFSLPQLAKQEMTPPVIHPVHGSIKRPRWSVMIPTYNCARFLRETLESVLSQDVDPAEMQIEVIDDCSTSDDPEVVVRDFGKGRVSFYRKPTNAGATANFNTCIERSIGHYVHILHGDDWVHSDFYRSVEERMTTYENPVDLVITRCFQVDEQGDLDSLSLRIRPLEQPSTDASCMFINNPVRTPGCVIRRSFYEAHGGFLSALVHTADWEMWTRAASLGKAVFINQPLAFYRIFEGNDTGRLARTADNILDYIRFGQVMNERFPSFPRRQFLEASAKIALNQKSKFLVIGDERGVQANDEVAHALLRELSIGRLTKVERAFRKARSIFRLQ